MTRKLRCLRVRRLAAATSDLRRTGIRHAAEPVDSLLLRSLAKEIPTDSDLPPELFIGRLQRTRTVGRWQKMRSRLTPESRVAGLPAVEVLDAGADTAGERNRVTGRFGWRDLRLARKLQLALSVSIGVALALVLAVYSVSHLMGFQRKTLEQLTTLADVAGTNSQAALTFSDRKAAEETLSMLRASPLVRPAAIYGKDGEVFGTDQRSGDDPNAVVFQKREPGSALPANTWRNLLQSELEMDRNQTPVNSPLATA